MIMKKVFNSLFVIIAAMVTFAGCAKQETDAPATSETKTVQFFANSIETKTVFGTPDGTTYPTLWTAGDKVKVHVNLSAPSGVTKTETSVDVKLVGGEAMASSATFTAELNDAFEAESYTLYSVSPSSAWNARSANEGRFTVNIKSEQTPLPTSVDSDAQVLYAISGPYTDGIPTSVNLDYKHFTAYGKLSLKGLSDGVVISKIKLESADLDLAGKWNYYVADESVAAKDGVKSITLETSSTTDIWFACAPVDVSGKTITLTVTTDKGNLVKEITFPANRKFEAGKISKFTVDMTGITAGGSEEPEQPGENEGTSVATLSSEEIKTKIAASKCTYGTPVSYEDMDDGVVWTSTCLTDADARPWLQMKADDNVYIKISSDSDIKEVEITVTGASNSKGGVLDITKHSSFSGTLSLNTQADGKGTNVSSGSAANNIVTLTPSGNYKTLYLKTSAGARIWNIDVKKSDGGNEGGSETPEPEPKTLVSIAVDGQTTTYTVGNTFEFDGTVTATYDDESTATVTPTSVSEPDMTTVGTKEITVSYTEGEVTAETKYTITVNEAPAGPIVATIAEFLAAEDSETVWYQLTGTISNIVNTTYGNFDLVDETASVYVYGLKENETATNTSFSKLGLKEGDYVTLIGPRSDYQGTAQVGTSTVKAYYVSHIPSCVAPVIACTDNIVTITAEEGATIYYTTNGDIPTELSTKYTDTEAFKITENTIVKAIAVATGKVKSVVTEKTCIYVDPNASGGDEKVPSTTACYTLDGTIKGGNSGYAQESSIKQNDISWGIVGNTDISPWRIGGKSINGVDRNVYTKTAYSSELSKIELVTGTATITWNSLTLEYSTNSDFSNSQTIVASGIGGSKTITFAPDGGFPANCYFRFKFNVTNSSSSSNKYVQLSAIKFYGYAN